MTQTAPQSTGRPFRVALTGGIASGKSTVANLFAAHGVPLIDTDLIARDVVEPGQPALAAVAQAFGSGVLDSDGRLDRRRLREIIFRDAAARTRLEAILHPAIRAEMERQSVAAAQAGPYQMLVIPLLAEGGRRDHVDRVLVVDTPETVQVERLMTRDAVTREQAEASLRAQAQRATRLGIADDVLANTGRIEDLREQVAALHARYVKLAAAGTERPVVPPNGHAAQ
ncbi:MAG: dephospho-CoA kinase [Steroidobacteraceae bacterium]|nr:dephospho-CoA kinase [Steroidobacteraceae bacterium]